MTSVAVPDNDLAPNLPSREVTISASDITEGGTSQRGQWVNFALSDSIDVTPGGDMIAKTSQTITLDSAGNGRVRLPVYDTSHGRGWESDKDWAIIVTTSWGSSKAIRVPAGSGSIPLSYLPAVRPLSRNEMRYAVTGVALTVSVGGTPGAAGGSATLDGGILRLGITVPPAGPHKHPASDITDLEAEFEARAVYRGYALLNTRYQTAQQGIYFVASTAVAEAMGLPVLRQGWLHIMVQGDVRRVDFSTNDVNDTNPLQEWSIATDQAGSWSASAWELTTVPQAVRELGSLLGTENLDTIQDGVAWVRSGSVATKLGLPPSGPAGIGRTGKVTTSSPVNAAYPRIQKWETDDVNDNYSLERWERSTTSSGDWRPWLQVYPQTSGGASSQRHEILETDQQRMVGGPIHTDGATPVALTWDDFPAAFRDLVVPMLRARSLTATLALPSRVLSAERAPYLGGEGITWPEIDAWVAEGLIEVANHSATHMDASAAKVRDETVTALEELHANLPSARVMCWVQPSVVYPGFNNGDSLDAWTATDAGRLILDHHALATGTWNRRSDATIERHGTPVQGLGRVWMDTSSGLTTVQARITSCFGTDRGLIVGAHANRPSLGGTYTTVAELTAFLDWLVVQRDAGKVRLMTLSQWALADVRPATTTTGALSAYLAARGA